MRTMGEGGLKRMDHFGSFGGFQGTNSGRTLNVFCQHLPFSLGGVETVGEGSKYKCEEEEDFFDSIEG